MEQVARYMDGGNYDTTRIFFVEERAVQFARDVGGYISAYLSSGNAEIWEVRYLKRRQK